MRSYSNKTIGLLASFREAWCLYRGQTLATNGCVNSYFCKLEFFHKQVRDLYGFEVENKDVLDIGPGQFLVQMHYFSVRNRVIGIDCDAIAQGFNIPTYIRMLQTNGLRRTAKTIARKALGVDRRYRKEISRKLGVSILPRLKILQMDVCQMSFPAESFDVVYCHSVFHHLPKPEDALAAITRVLRPGGVAYISLHLYTSSNGSLDPRIFDPSRNFPPWAHLRDDLALDVQSNAYLNRLRLFEWREIFSRALQGSQLILMPTKSPSIAELAKDLHAAGKLKNYAPEELTTHELALFWQKPDLETV